MAAPKSNVVALPSKTKAPAKKIRRRSRKVKSSADLGVMDQVSHAFRAGNRLSTFVGFLLGGLIPLVVYMVGHCEIDLYSFSSSMIPHAAIVLGGLVYSAKTVFEWGRKAFHSAPKALGFVVLAEGVMTFSTISWLAITALVYLVVINGVATGVSLALDTLDRK